MMPLLRPASTHVEEWNLPSVQDLLNGVQPVQDVPKRPASTTVIVCQTCLSKDRKVSLLPGEACSYCTADRHAGYMNVERRHSYANIIINSSSIYAPQPEDYARRPSLTYLPENGHASSGYLPIKSALTPFQSPMPSPGLVGTPFSPVHHSHPFSAPTPVTRTKPRSNQHLSDAKIASNDRHKLMEKQRRDGMGAFVYAAAEMRSFISPAVIAGCKICSQDAESAVTNTSPTACDSSSTDAPVSNKKNKKPRSDVLEESLMWEFSWILHFAPDELPSRLEDVRKLAEQMGKEKSNGLANDPKNKKKWDADVRAIVLIQALKEMVMASERHGLGERSSVASEGTTEDTRNLKSLETGSKRKRRLDVVEEEAEFAERLRRASASPPTPPSSTGSQTPSYQNERSREVSTSEWEENDSQAR